MATSCMAGTARGLPQAALTVALVLASVGVRGHRGAARRGLSSTATGGAPQKVLFTVLGDSLSDTGNTARYLNATDFYPYWNARFSNGPIWVDYLNATLSASKQVDAQFVSYAWVAAWACNTRNNYTIGRYPWVHHVPTQAQDVLTDLQTGKLVVGQDRELVPIILAGANDVSYFLRDALASGGSTPEQQVEFVAGLIKCKIETAQLLFAAGAKRIVYLPMAPFYLSAEIPDFIRPQVRLLVDTIDQQTALALAGVEAQLAALPPGIPGAGAKLFYLGTNSWAELLANTISPPFKYIGPPCFWVPVTARAGDPLNNTICDDPTEYFFYDEQHPTTRYHSRYVTKGLIPRLQNFRILPAKI